MKKYFLTLLVCGVVYYIYKDLIYNIVNHAFISSIIPYSWLIVRLLMGVVFAISLTLTLMLIGRGLFGDLAAFLTFIPCGVIFYWVGMHVFGFMEYAEFNFNLLHWFLYWVISGCVTGFVLLKYSRKITKKIQEFIERNNQRNWDKEQSTEEIFKEHAKLVTATYNPQKYWKLDDGKIFLSLGVDGVPHYVDYEGMMKKSHGNATGKSQMGKNVAIQQVLIQLMLMGEFIVMCDAKSGGDDVMAPILYKYTTGNNQPYNYVELSLTAPTQFNILQIKDVDFLKQILMQLAKLEETDDMAVQHYIGKDDAAAQKIALFIAQSSEELTIYDIVTKHMDKFFDLSAKEQSTLQTALTKLSYKPCINAKDGFKYEDLIKAGGCLYLQAKTKDDNIILSVVVSSLRFVRSQMLIQRVVTVFADEFMKYASQDFIDIMTEGAGKGFKLITAYQTSALLEIKSIGKTASQMLSVIMANNNYEFLYGTRDPLVLDAFEEHYSGNKVVHEETQEIETSIVLADKTTGAKRTKRKLVARYPKELLTKLRTGEHFLYRAGELMELCYNGYLPLLSGKFDKNSTEFVELVRQSRKITLEAVKKIPEQNEKKENLQQNPFD